MTGPRVPAALAERIRAAVATYGSQLIMIEHGQDHGAELAAHLAALDQIVEDAFAAGVAAQPPRECYVPAVVPWRRVRARDVVLDYGQDEAGDAEPDLWAVERSGWLAGLDTRERAWGLTVVSTTRQRIESDPDDRISVLVRCDLHDAIALTGEQLGARLIATRTSPDGTTDGDPAWRVDTGATTTIGGP